ncbi:putative pentatricopeptide repeat-containing protein At1g16830 [Impatiens glandulifera]|uniref:putative pentatricopeptide repeat-containing protein At1g16830 n=1 Tax=Impatiens glandulifera TaxID=253017 RepID=UPI001FB06F2B|nr:putative pentatricopeptide repeat-containing protein At1g16830 [Impatiens glandulifera]
MFLQKLRQAKKWQNRVLQKYTADSSGSWSYVGHGKVRLYATGLSLITERSSCMSSFHIQHPRFPNPMNVFYPGSLQGIIRLSSNYKTNSVKKTFSTNRNDMRSGTSTLGKLSVALNRVRNISKSEASQPYEDGNFDLLMESAFSSSLLGNASNVEKSNWKNKDELTTCSTTFYNDVEDHDINGASQPKELNNNKRSQDNVILEKTGRRFDGKVKSTKISNVLELSRYKMCIEHIQDHSKNYGIGLSHCLVLSTLKKSPSDLIALSLFFWCARQKDYFHDRTAFDHMANVVKRLFQNFDTTKGILHQLEKVGCVVKPQVFLLLLRIVWHGKHYKHVFEVVEEMIHYGCTPNTLCRNIVMDSLFKIERIEVAMRVLKETQDPNFLTFNVALCNLCKLNDLANIQYVLREMLMRRYYPNAGNFSMVLSCYCKKGRLTETLQLLGLMIALGIPISVNIWSILVDGFCKHGEMNIASGLLDKMVECGYTPNVVTFTPLIKGLMKSQKLSNALDVLHNMESRGLMPDLVLCNVLIDCLSKMHMFDAALDIFFSMRKENLVPDSYTLSSIISTVCLSRNFTLLPKLIHDIPLHYDLPVYNSVLGYLCKSGFPSNAVEFYDDMIFTGFVPDAYTYAGLLRGLFGMGWISRAVNEYSAIVNQYGADPHIHTIAMNGLIRLGKFHKANTLFRNAAAEKQQLDVVSYTVAIHGLLSSGRTDEAYNLYLLMKNSGVDPNVYTYNIMVSGFCTVKDNEKVEWLLQEMLGAGIPLNNNTYQKIRNPMHRSQSSYSVVRLLFKMCYSGLVSKEVTVELLGQEIHPQTDLDERSKGLFEPSLIDSNASESNIHLDLATSVG